MEADSSRGTVVAQNIYHEWGGNGNRGQAREIHPHDHWYQLMTFLLTSALEITRSLGVLRVVFS